MQQSHARRYPIGAELLPKGGVHFRLWAPRARRVDVVIDRDEVPLKPEPDGYFAGPAPRADAGTRYSFRLDDSTKLLPDPASRFQPEGPHGPSEVIDPAAFAWGDRAWRGPEPGAEVLYEMHIGTFTPAGTWAAAARELPALADLGITVVELMPVAEFGGEFGWGYDGVGLYAPTRLYGTPDDARRFVDTAHALGLAVILDVVYNHLGPDGNYLGEFSREYFTDRYRNDWGRAINFDGPGAGPVREFFITNAIYWIEEFHFDGLRLDATQSIFDASQEHVIAAVARRVRAAAGARRLLLVGESEPQDVTLLQPRAQGGLDLDALWNDDFHHTAVVAATGVREAYYTDYRGTPQELISAARHGFLYQGQHYAWQKQRRGTPTFGIPPTRFIHYLENHDQVANTAWGTRLHQRTAPGTHRALTALLLLSPQLPLLFQGQEFSSSAPFLYFADHEPELAARVRVGRGEFLTQFPSIASVLEELHDPADRAAFTRCKLDPAECERNTAALRLHRDLLRLRRDDPAIRAARSSGVDGAVIEAHAFVLRYLEPADAQRLLVVNLGVAIHPHVVPEPLLAPPLNHRWESIWSSDAAAYGGAGHAPLEREDGWWIPGFAATLLAPVPANGDDDG